MHRILRVIVGVTATAACIASGVTAPSSTARGATAKTSAHVWHNSVVSTTFWVGEIFSSGPNGSQVISTYDSKWELHYGGCDGLVKNGKCRTERRIASNGYFPQHMAPKQNPFYLDVPFDDVNDPVGAAERAKVIPWADVPHYRRLLAHPNKSLMKNHWVEIIDHGHTCYGQVEDAGPGQYHDAAYVFGGARPSNRRYNGAGMDVSPALNGCLGFKSLNGDTDVVRWRFVAFKAVAPGPWRKLVTRR